MEMEQCFYASTQKAHIRRHYVGCASVIHNIMLDSNRSAANGDGVNCGDDFGHLRVLTDKTKYWLKVLVTSPNEKSKVAPPFDRKQGQKQHRKLDRKLIRKCVAG